MKLPLLAGVWLLLTSFFAHRHFLSVLLCLEALTLMLVFCVSSLSLAALGHMVFFFLLLGVTEAALGLSILVSITRSSSIEKSLL